MNKQAKLRSLLIDGPVGRMEAQLNEGAAESQCAGLVLHPHPLGGGTMHNKVVYHAMKALNSSEHGLGLPVLRFNFRGVGLSTGKHDGEAEVEDVLAALAWLRAEYGLPIALVGFSFGSVMAIRALSAKEATCDVISLALLGLPIEASFCSYEYPTLKNILLPKLFVSGEADEYAELSKLSEVIGLAAAPKEFIHFPGADHFFSGHLDELQTALRDWQKGVLSLSSGIYRPFRDMS